MSLELNNFHFLSFETPTSCSSHRGVNLLASEMQKGLKEHLLSLDIPSIYHRCHIHLTTIHESEITYDDYDTIYKNIKKEVLQWRKNNNYPRVHPHDLIEGKIYCIVGKRVYTNNVIIIKFQEFLGYLKEENGSLVWLNAEKQTETPYNNSYPHEDLLYNYEYSGIQDYGFKFTSIRCVEFPEGITEGCEDFVFFELPSYYCTIAPILK